MKKIRLSRSRVLNVAVPAVLVIISSITIALCRQQTTEWASQRVCGILQSSATEQADAVNTSIESNKAVLTALAGTIIINDGRFDEQKILKQMEDIARGSDLDMTAVCYVDTRGNAYFTDGRVCPVLNMTFFSDAMEGKTDIEYISSGYFLGKAGLLISMPITKDGVVQAVLAGIINNAKFQELLENHTFGSDGYNILCGSDGNVVSMGGNISGITVSNNYLQSLSDSRFAGGCSLDQITSDIRSGKSGFTTYFSGGKEFCAAYSPAEVNGWYYFSVLSKEKVDDEVTELQKTTDIMLAVIVVCALFLYGINFFSERRRTSLIISEQNRELARISTKASTDNLTGLLNREEAMSQISKFLQGEGHGFRHALLIIDLDNFKGVNDTFGHFEGDKVLIMQAARIKSVFRDMDIVGRLGGDEFIVLMKYIAEDDVIRRKTEELVDALDYLYLGGDYSISISGSVGVTICSDFDKGMDELYKEADAALYHAKFDGKKKICFFNQQDVSQIQTGTKNGPFEMVVGSGIAFLKIKTLVEKTGGVMMLEMGRQVRVIYASPKYTRQKRKRNAGNSALNFIFPEDIEKIMEVLRQSAETGSPAETMFRYTDESGKTVWQRMNAVRMDLEYGEADDPVILALMADATEIEEAKRKNDRLKSRFEKILTLSGLATFEVDTAERTMKLSPEAARLLPIDSGTFNNAPDILPGTGIIHPDSVETYRKLFNNLYSGIPEGTADLKIRQNNGITVLIRISYYLMENVEDCAAKAFGVIRILDAEPG